jgi:hypothetical protein
VVCQDLLQDPLVVGSRKVNIRIYLLIVVDESNSVSFYMYEDGFMYYTPTPWTPNTTLISTNVTTGYIDRQVYVDNPLTLVNLMTLLGKVPGDLLMNNIKSKLARVCSIYSDNFKTSNATYPGKKFQIFGCDIAPSATLDCTIMEINKGPDLSYKDDNDKAVKLEMVKNALRLVGIIRNEQPMGFYKLMQAI